jgi:glycosyltransferase involved in cell wall biosynthesis
LSKDIEKPVKVLFIEHFGVGGLVHYAHCLCQALAERGVQVSLLTASDYELIELPRSFRLLNRLPIWNPHVRSKRQGGLWRRLEQASKGVRYLAALGIALLTIWREKPDVVHIGEMKFLSDLVLFLLHGRKIVYTCHNIQRFSDKPTGDILQSSRLWFHAHTWMYRRCDGIIFHTQKSLQEFQSLFGFEPDRWTVIPHGEYNLFAPSREISLSQARQALELEQAGQIVLFFGAIRRYKGLDILLEAIACLHAHKQDVRLLVAGAPGRDVNIQSFEAQAQQLGVENNVTWHVGYVPHHKVHLYFYASDVVALAHRKVYDSGVLKIAQALGRPAVVTGVGGLPAAVREGQAGLIVPPNDPQALADALDTLLSDTALAKSLAKRGQELAHGEFSWANVAQHTEQFYRTLRESTCAS